MDFEQQPQNVKDLAAAAARFLEGWGHFCSKIVWKDSTLDADAIAWMNEVPPQIEQALYSLNPEA